MWYIASVLVLLIGITISIARSKVWDKVGLILFTWVFGGLLAVILAFPILGYTTGLGEGFSVGQRQGYITKVS